MILKLLVIKVRVYLPHKKVLVKMTELDTWMALDEGNVLHDCLEL